VLEPDCSLRGYRRLWVCDASVFPRVPRANTQLPVMAVAERVSAMLSGVVPASL
jgi:choline dehydrogenase/5-(hydroxymethyl)furfural/furfural oxidase